MGARRVEGVTNHTVCRGWRWLRLRSHRSPKTRIGEWEKSKGTNRNMKKGKQKAPNV